MNVLLQRPNPAAHLGLVLIVALCRCVKKRNEQKKNLNASEHCHVSPHDCSPNAAFNHSRNAPQMHAHAVISLTNTTAILSSNHVFFLSLAPVRISNLVSHHIISLSDPTLSGSLQCITCIQQLRQMLTRGIKFRS